jgi:hypothetical protein
VEGGGTSRRELHTETENKMDTSRLRKRRILDPAIEASTRRDSGFVKENNNKVAKSEESGFGLKDIPRRSSKHDVYEGSFRLDDENGKSFHDLPTPKTRKSLFDIIGKRRGSERTSVELTKDQLNLIEDKSVLDKSKHRFSISVSGDRRPLTQNKFLDAISRIAARRDSQDPGAAPSANIFAQALVS